MKLTYRAALAFLLLLSLAACWAASGLSPLSTPTPGTPTALALPTASSTPTLFPPTASPTQSAPPVVTPKLSPVSFYDPAGCRKPPDGMRRLEVNGWVLNERTLAMLQHARELYGGPIDITRTAITQGSYHDNGAASFGTHLGGGAVDLAIFQPGTWAVDFAHLQRLVRALRAAGFAAWVRDLNEVFPGSGYHIHAIAIGDPQLSKEAVDQLSGPFGYFRGFNGLPKPDGKPVADRDGGLVLCQWMVDMKYSDLRADPSQPPAGWPASGWQQRLLRAAANFQTRTAAQTVALARALDYYPGKAETPQTMEGPLAGALWREAGFLPPGLNKASLLGTYLADPQRVDRLWGMLPPDDYLRFHFDTSPANFDFSAWRLLPGDLVELSGSRAEARMFVVTEMDKAGRVYTVTPQKDGAGVWRVERLLLYDPTQAGAGMFRGAWAGPDTTRLEVLRYRWTGLPVSYTVQPGDTLPGLAARFEVSAEAIVRANLNLDPAHLKVGQPVSIP